ncbi:MAG: TfoX/Sxy family protein [Pseudooceanicola sp.]|nr:TfoX/Sxy family protein [Pseudooceanicola sp.]
MAYDEAIADMMRADLGLRSGLSEKRMFGGICFLLDGNMVCAVHPRGAMYRVGKEAVAEALELGAGRMHMGERVMGGWADLSADHLDNDDLRAALTGMALAFVATLPAKGD